MDPPLDDAFPTGRRASKAAVLLAAAQLTSAASDPSPLSVAGRRASKTLQHCMLLLGHELLEAGDASAAERLLTQVAGAAVSGRLLLDAGRAAAT